MPTLRLAHTNDIKDITELIQQSARILGGKYYDSHTIEAALTGAFGVDTQLIKDKTYFVMEDDNSLIACGGWSYRKTLFGSDNNNIRNPRKLNPETEAAKIRAFFIHPGFARQGLGKVLLDKCEAKARKSGFTMVQLMSTLSGITFYKKNGYQGNEYIYHDMGDQKQIKFLPMQKNLSHKKDKL